jgi:predicted transcriptional regulator
MDKPEHDIDVPAGWLDALAESEAQLAAGQIVPGEEVMRELLENIERLKAKHADKLRRRTAPRR